MDTSAESDTQQPEEDQAAAPAPVVEVAQSAKKSSGDAKKPLKRLHGKRKKQRRSSRASRQNQLTLQQVTDRFAACGRCSYFWAGYRVIFGEDALATAVAQSEAGWLELEWNLEMPELVHKSYGVRLDILHFHYEGCCQECRRTFVYQAAEDEEETDEFRIEISPRMAK
ncbi:MAG: hypothetical protein CL608_03315 [Anaerolineaceae bacterium]|nr:hypothetical protein [Anaerolineaceae bacterium]